MVFLSRFWSKGFKDRHHGLRHLLAEARLNNGKSGLLEMPSATRWCGRCIQRLYAIPPSTFRRLRANVVDEHASALRHPLPSDHKEQIIAALCALAVDHACYLPDTPRRIIPFRTWAQARETLQASLGFTVSSRSLLRARKDPSSDIGRLRAVHHAACTECVALNAVITHTRDPNIKAEKKKELKAHLQQQLLHRKKFYYHNFKAL